MFKIPRRAMEQSSPKAIVPKVTNVTNVTNVTTVPAVPSISLTTLTSTSASTMSPTPMVPTVTPITPPAKPLLKLPPPVPKKGLGRLPLPIIRSASKPATLSSTKRKFDEEEEEDTSDVLAKEEVYVLYQKIEARMQAMAQHLNAATAEHVQLQKLVHEFMTQKTS